MHVLLCGGPARFPEDWRRMAIDVGQLDDRITVPFYGGFEHFERLTDEVDAAEGAGEEAVLRYQWLYRTEIAE
ncbi:DUF5988 family protein [Streptomyces albicerus]|uniref:DUF5988 family protein n=1 Tax=Streptomyces albicerus TaxID=2569859 RepID=UPI001CECB421|nr:DUF5988 family protein [Streptomyces albicerus]